MTDPTEGLFEHPMAVLRRLLPPEESCPSHQLAARTGVSASVIRGIRNGRHTHTRVDIWARLMWWALLDAEVRSVPVPAWKHKRGRKR